MTRFIHREYRQYETKQVGAGTIVEHGAPFPEILMHVLIIHLSRMVYCGTSALLTT